MIRTLNSQTITPAELAKTIDHALLRPEMPEAEVMAGCELADQYHIASVCVKPCDVALAARRLAKSDVAVGTVIGFPHGSSTTATKVAEARQALDDGATELDMVINIGALRSGKLDYVRNEIAAVVDAARGRGHVKVILENAYLTDEQKVAVCLAAEAAGAAYVKTSTGFAPTGVTVADIKLMRATVSPQVGVKAAHGIRTLAAILEIIDAGATRVGATATATILDDFKKLRGG
ncbi:MAG: deoxyribose-phosphate aldolase [Anaerolineales bacterium]|nr:deoxyribose-phosphate aldolase [Anaerolineales bacterium]